MNKPHAKSQEPRVSNSLGMRMLWRVGGAIALGLGILGIPLPLLPTTPFLLLAAFCFARSSPPLHRWLISHRHFGPPIIRWRDCGAISRKAKTLAALAMAAGFMGALAFGAPLFALIAQVVVLTFVGAFIFTRPEE